MKKLMLLAAAAATLAACTSEEEVFTGTQQEINLSAVGQKATRGAIDGANLTTDGKAKGDNNEYLPMWAWAVHHGAASGSHTSHILFQNLKYTFQTDVWHSASDKYYYPIGADAGTMDFMAYSTNADADKFSVSDITTSTNWKDLSDGTLLYKVTFDDGELDGTKEFLYTDAKTVTCPATTAPELVFKHSQAYITFIVKAGDATTASNLSIRSIKLNNVVLSGKANVKWEVESGTIYKTKLEWTDKPAATDHAALDYTSEATLPKPGQTEGTWLTGGLLILPQPKTGFTLDYVINQGGTSGTNTDLIYTYTYDSASSSYPANWEAGKKYIYEITIGLNEIVLNAKVDGYSEEGYTVAVPSGTVTQKTSSTAPARK